MPKKAPSSVKITNFAQVLKNRAEINKLVFRIEPTGESYYVKDGQKLSVEDVDAMYPTTFISESSLIKLDGKKSYLHN